MNKTGKGNHSPQINRAVMGIYFFTGNRTCITGIFLLQFNKSSVGIRR